MMTDLTFLHGARSPGCTAVVDKRFEGYSTLQFMTAGGVELLYGEVRHELRGAWFWTAEPGPQIRFHAAPGVRSWDHRYVAFRGSQVNSWKAANLWPKKPQPMPEGRNHPARFDEMLENMHRGDHWGGLRAALLLELILIDLAEARAQPMPREAWLEDALQLLNTGGDFMPDYDRIAKQCGMALSTLRRRFRESTGTTLHDYVIRKRVAGARDLLGNTDLPIKAIALRLGYGDVHFFASQFRRCAGVPPAAYRRSRQA